MSKIFPKIGVYVNADDLKKEYNISDMEAAKQAENIRSDLLNKKLPFSFETVLSTDRNLILLQKAKIDGYEVQCVYVLTCNPLINVARVKSRVKSGGHDVPDDKIVTRYYRALELLPKVIAACDKIVVYDNSDKPVLIFEKNDDTQKYYPNQFWNDNDLKKLLGL
ncbi:MAG: zeta toxin family protein [Eubacteriales bacterium]